MMNFSISFVNSLSIPDTAQLFAEAFSNSCIAFVAITELAQGITESIAIELTSYGMDEFLDAQGLPSRSSSIQNFREYKNIQDINLVLLTNKLVSSGVFRA
uniref:Uncharacterized protein n=1 Tax=Monilinia fructicola TaxID=38448 RepID=A0A889XPH4_MONFR|nr:hypothetical protein KQ509_mgp21 [Monilinia fructicola]QRF72246.1 hypothetical protein [Monilinia fructicola]